MVRYLMVCVPAVLLLVCSDAALSKMVYESKTGFIRSIEAKVDVGWQYSHLKAQDDRRSLVVLNDQGMPRLRAVTPLTKKDRRSERRRLKTKLQVKFNRGFTFYLQIEEGFKHVNPTYSNQRSYVDKLWGSWKHNKGHELLVGYTRPSFGVEEQASFFDLRAIERSIASNYFNGVTSASSNRPNGFVGTPLGIGNKHLGVYGTWIQGQSTFRLSLAKETFNPFGPPKAAKNRALGLYSSWHWDAGKPHKLGVNLAVLPDGVVYKPIAAQQFGRLVAINPYFILAGKKTYMMAELFAASLTNAAVSSGANAMARPAADNARSIGLTLVISRAVLTRLELVGRFSYLNSGSSGFSSGRFSDVVRGAPFDSTARPGNFDQAVSGYVGLNVRLTKSLGLKAGYERISTKKDLNYLQLNTDEGKQLHDGSKASIGVFRAQVWLKV